MAYDDRIDRAFEQWLRDHRGKPMTSKEIADMAGMNDSSIRQMCNRIYLKIRKRHTTPVLLEYADE